jgi:hypothetical protein
MVLLASSKTLSCCFGQAAVLPTFGSWICVSRVGDSQVDAFVADALQFGTFCGTDVFQAALQGDASQIGICCGDASQGDSSRGDSSRGDASQGDASQGDASQGDASQGDASQGDASQGDALWGGAFPGSASGGDASRGDTSHSDTSHGDASRGNASCGDTSRGDASCGVFLIDSCLFLQNCSYFLYR